MVFNINKLQHPLNVLIYSCVCFGFDDIVKNIFKIIKCFIKIMILLSRPGRNNSECELARATGFQESVLDGDSNRRQGWETRDEDSAGRWLL